MCFRSVLRQRTPVPCPFTPGTPVPYPQRRSFLVVIRPHHLRSAAPILPRRRSVAVVDDLLLSSSSAAVILIANLLLSSSSSPCLPCLIPLLSSSRRISLTKLPHLPCLAASSPCLSPPSATPIEPRHQAHPSPSHSNHSSATAHQAHHCNFMSPPSSNPPLEEDWKHARVPRDFFAKFLEATDILSGYYPTSYAKKD
ncbi:hypothetical protein ACLOJK_041180 [Asimina triloba]